MTVAAATTTSRWSGSGLAVTHATRIVTGTPIMTSQRQPQRVATKAAPPCAPEIPSGVPDRAATSSRADSQTWPLPFENGHVVRIRAHT